MLYPDRLRPEHKDKEEYLSYEIVTDIDKTNELLSLQEAKDFMLVDFDDHDNVIQMLISAAREQLEQYTGYSIGQRTIKLIGDLNADNIYYPLAPYREPDVMGVQFVGFTAGTLPADIKLAWLNLVHIAFNNRAANMDFGLALKQMGLRRRRVGI